ncbi:glycosyltransferase family 1 protein [Thermothielavioides terrestris NRRL 8126]|uniref:UDP-N-acetylglucosamine transferase subunit ALG13 n=1 Tax=Thermothielavioides terrestris (strain ATCC 38088 / NRRL 8126) TaxID=578455 RepID=G2QUJ9_THETT|nr:glycosyltransferase family 1 protein [Thermothielavioides terrestris NRRL 8126]AEO64554.1 glycosyltransferase family 1 protein [Thermothielavioides terrestris NRRL 8126]
MVNDVNGVNGSGGGGPGRGSMIVLAAPPRETKRRRSDVFDDLDPAHQSTAQPMLAGRRCFVTVGATASFRALLDEVSTPEFLRCLADHGFTVLEAQCGPDLAAFQDRVASLTELGRHGVEIRCFDYTGDLVSHIEACRGEANVRRAGCVISHGGTGTVGEVLSVGAALIVVANPTLMDNHQLELAETLEEENRAVQGHLGNLTAAIERIAERIRQGTLDALPPYSPPPFPVPAADRVTLFDWIVLTCYPDELEAQERLGNLAVAPAVAAANNNNNINDLDNISFLRLD